MRVLKIDAYPHILPTKYMEALERKASTRTFTNQFARDLVPAMYDLDTRFRIMDRYEGYVQILNVTQPPVETVGARMWPPSSPDWLTMSWRIWCRDTPIASWPRWLASR